MCIFPSLHPYPKHVVPSAHFPSEDTEGPCLGPCKSQSPRGGAGPGELCMSSPHWAVPWALQEQGLPRDHTQTLPRGPRAVQFCPEQGAPHITELLNSQLQPAMSVISGLSGVLKCWQHHSPSTCSWSSIRLFLLIHFCCQASLRVGWEVSQFLLILKDYLTQI